MNTAVPARAAGPRRRQSERTARSDARMLDAAVALIVERGAAGTTLKAIGERAGYSRGLAGYRFGSKAGLLGFVVRAVGEQWLAELTRVTAGRTGLEAMTAATDAHLRFCREAPLHVRAFYVLWFESIGPGSEIRDVIAHVHQRRQRDVEAWIRAGMAHGTVRAGIDPAACADTFCAGILGIVYQWLLEPSALGRIDDMHEALKTTMARLLGTNPGETGR